jgi:hypothetical protein
MQKSRLKMAKFNFLNVLKQIDKMNGTQSKLICFMLGHIPLQIVSNKDKKASERQMNREYQRTAKSKALFTA